MWVITIDSGAPSMATRVLWRVAAEHLLCEDGCGKNLAPGGNQISSFIRAGEFPLGVAGRSGWTYRYES